MAGEELFCIQKKGYSRKWQRKVSYSVTCAERHHFCCFLFLLDDKLENAGDGRGDDGSYASFKL